MGLWWRVRDWCVLPVGAHLPCCLVHVLAPSSVWSSEPRRLSYRIVTTLLPIQTGEVDHFRRRPSLTFRRIRRRLFKRETGDQLFIHNSRPMCGGTEALLICARYTNVCYHTLVHQNLPRIPHGREARPFPDSYATSRQFVAGNAPPDSTLHADRSSCVALAPPPWRRISSHSKSHCRPTTSARYSFARWRPRTTN